MVTSLRFGCDCDVEMRTLSGVLVYTWQDVARSVVDE